MSDDYPTIPNFDQMLAQRIAVKTSPTAAASKGTIDPYEQMLQRKLNATAKEAEIVVPKEIQKWPEEDVKKLEDYCKKIGAIGFNPGRMPPLVALAMLKQQYGDFSDVPLEDRVPQGYEKIGTPKYNSNYPYEQAMKDATGKKQILHG